jgi:single-stranded-DNA-specific exonuclease
VEKRWIIAPADEACDGTIRWSEVCDMPCILALLKRKGFVTVEEVTAFLKPRLGSLRDPFLLPNMAAAVTRVVRAIDGCERVVLFGDYDVDGVTSLALLAEMLRSYGAAPELFLPLRMEEGYGLSAESVERCFERHRPQLLIAVDCGTSSIDEIAELKRRGVDVVVLDHHEPKSALPDCVAVVNPKTEAGCAFQYLCSVGIVFKLCHALLKTRPSNFDLKAHLDLVALGTVADIVPLQNENRIFVQRGMVEMARSRRPGLRTLIEVAAVRSPIAAEDIAFRLGPRLNAAGRLDTAERALQLLIAKDEAEAMVLARVLDTQNRERQEVEKKIFGEAEEELGKNLDPAAAAIVVGAPEWHPGVLGIVASRLARKYYRPAIVVGFDSNGLGKGSGRSLEGFSLVEAMARCEKWLVKFGGHAMAAGLTIRAENFLGFTEAFRQTARELLSAEVLEPRLHLDHELGFSEMNGDLLRWYQAMQPFGSGNLQPMFFARGVEPVVAPLVLKEKHLVLRLRQQNHFRRAIFFGGASSPLPSPPWDMAFRLSADEYEGETRLQIQVEALRTAARIE